MTLLIFYVLVALVTSFLCSDRPLLSWPLDHAYASENFALIRFEPMRDVGSDHLPVLAVFCRKQAGQTV